MGTTQWEALDTQARTTTRGTLDAYEGPLIRWGFRPASSRKCSILHSSILSAFKSIRGREGPDLVKVHSEGGTWNATGIHPREPGKGSRTTLNTPNLISEAEQGQAWKVLGCEEYLTFCQEARIALFRVRNNPRNPPFLSIFFFVLGFVIRISLCLCSTSKQPFNAST